MDSHVYLGTINSAAIYKFINANFFKNFFRNATQGHKTHVELRVYLGTINSAAIYEFIYTEHVSDQGRYNGCLYRGGFSN